MRRVSPAVLLTVVVLAGALSAPLRAGAATTSTTAPANAAAAAQLAEAPIPPGAQATSASVTSSVASEPLPTSLPNGPQYDAYALYDDALAPATVISYLQAHPPSGDIWLATGNSLVPGVSRILLRLPVSGVHVQGALDTYTVVADGTGAEVRVDAQLEWNPSRPASEVAPSSGTVEVTGYKSASDERGVSGPVTVSVHGKQAQRIRQAFDALPVGADTGCTVDLTRFTIVFAATGTPGDRLTVTNTGCSAPEVVSVATPSGPLDPLLDDCALTRAVLAVLPLSKVPFTRARGQACAGPHSTTTTTTTTTKGSAKPKG